MRWGVNLHAGIYANVGGRMTFRANHICVICEKQCALSPWVICKKCGDWVANNWNREAYRV